MSQKPLVIYHAHCIDGLTAAWVARRSLHDADVHPASHGSSPPDLTGRDVYMLDFAYPRPVMEAIARQVQTLVVLDHHKTAAADLAGLGSAAPNIRLEFDMHRSGARLAWDWFHPDEREDAPWLVRYVEDRDLWRFALPYSRHVTTGIDAYEHTLESWDALAERDLEEVAREGRVIETYRRRCIEAACTLALPMVIAGYQVRAANCSERRFASDTAMALADGFPFGATYWITAGGGVRFSVRSPAEGLDVSEIAKSFGGGGHEHAAGFEVSLEELAQMIYAGATAGPHSA
jgi:hypothetical protein